MENPLWRPRMGKSRMKKKKKCIWFQVNTISLNTSKNECHGIHKQKLRIYIFCMYEWTTFIQSVRHKIVGCAYGH